MSRADSRYRGGGRSLRNAFRELKQRGPQVLVTGDVSEAVSRRATQRLLGHPEEPRHRVLALTDSDAASDQWFPGSHSADDDEVTLIGAGDLRGSAAMGAPADGTSEEDALLRLVDEEVSTWCPRGDTPPPAVLRVGVYSLETLLETHGVETVRTFAYQLTGEVRRARGMGHYHLPREPDSEAVSDLQYVFDARLELRHSAGEPEQRWHLPGRGTTGWVELGEP